MKFEAPALEADSVHIWHLDLHCTPQEAEMLEEVLSEDERLTATCFREERFRLRFVKGRALLRELLAAYTGLQAGKIQFQLTSNGKPSLVKTNGSVPLHFNFSHAEDRATCAVTRIGPVGVDLERVRHWKDLPELEKAVFTETERVRLEQLDPAARVREFFRLWTHKEAFLKATGAGLGTPPETFEVDLGSGTLHSPNYSPEDWHLLDVTRDEGWPAAVAIECERVSVLRCA